MKKIAQLLLKLSAHFASRSRSESQSPTDRRLTEEFEGWLVNKEYLDADQTMGSLALKWNVAKEEISDYTRLHFGKNFLTFRKELRIKEAKNIIKSRPDLSVRQVGEMVGINDCTNFKRQFCEVTGESIHKYIHKVRDDGKK